MLDYLDKMQFDMQNDMMEWNHTNYFGGKKVTLFLGAYLQEQYGELLRDHRGQTGYESWEDQVDAHNAFVDAELSKTE